MKPLRREVIRTLLCWCADVKNWQLDTTNTCDEVLVSDGENRIVK